MFIETYYDEKSAVPAGSGRLAIPYPELVGEELDLWQRYLPIKSELENVPFWIRNDMPRVVIKQLEDAQTAPHLFERIEIWSRAGDPMAVGVSAGEPTRYFSIARWGDAKLTLQQVRKRLQIEKWIFWLLPMATVLFLLIGLLALATHAGPIS